MAIIFDVAKGISWKVPLIKYVLMHSNLCPYLATLIVAALYITGDATKALKRRKVIKIVEKDFDKFLTNKRVTIYSIIRILAWYYCLHPMINEPVDQEVLYSMRLIC